MLVAVNRQRVAVTKDANSSVASCLWPCSAIEKIRRAFQGETSVSGGSAKDRCSTRFSDLPKDVSRALSRTRSATLERINPQGGVERLSMRIDDIQWDAANETVESGLYQYLIASTNQAAGEQREVYQGTRGAMLYVDDTLVGMVVSAPDANTVRALRIEEILAPVSRWLSSGSLAALRNADGPEVQAPEGLPYIVTEWSGQPSDPSLPPTGLASGTAPFRVQAQGGQVSVAVQISEAAPVAVRELFLAGPKDATLAASPRSVTIEVDRGRPGASNFVPYASAEMTPDVPLTIPLNTFARQLRVKVNSVWARNLPVEISSLRVIPVE